MVRVAVVVVAMFTVALAVTPAARGPRPQSAATAPTDAAATKLITTLCGSCHTMGSIAGTHRTRQDWEEVLEWMIDEGAVMSDDEFDRVFGYLSVRYGRVDINTAPADEIRHVLELTEGQANRVVVARTQGRRYETLEAVADAAGVPEAFFEARRARVDFGG